MMVATVVAGIGIDLPGHHIMAMATASLVSYSFSMGFGAFMAGESHFEGSMWKVLEWPGGAHERGLRLEPAGRGAAGLQMA